MVKQATASNETHAADAAAADASVSKFLDAVWMERGLSANTLAAYRADLTALAVKIQLAERSARTVWCIFDNTASGAAAANLSMRGLTFADIEKSFDPTVAVVVDGVFLGTSTGQFLDFYDIGKIEVLRGPQGTGEQGIALFHGTTVLP